LPGLFIGIAVSLLLLLYRASRPHVAVLGRDPGGAGRWSDVERHPDNEQLPGVVVLRPESGLFFANADPVRDAIRSPAREGPRARVLEAETVPDIDVTAVTMLVGVAAALRDRGIELVVARDIGSVRDLLELGGDDVAIRTYPTVRAAVAALEDASASG